MLRIGGKRTIVDLFRENVDRVPGRAFVRFAGTEYSYGEIGHHSEQLAAAMAAAGIGRRDRIALVMNNRPAFVVAFLAVLRCGATAVPLNTQYRPDEVRYALDHAQCRAVVTEENLLAGVSEACEQVSHKVVLWQACDGEEGRFEPVGGAAEPLSREQGAPGPDDLAGVFYTSGTTARPKGVMISHENMMYSAYVTIRSLALSGSDVPLLAFPLFHVNSLFYGVLPAIVMQGSIGLLPGFSVSRYWNDAVACHATWTPGITGPLLRLLMEQDERPEESRHALRLAVGGGFESLDQIRQVRERFGITLLPGWSMTETVCLGTLHPVDRPTPVPLVNGIGYPTLGQEIRLVGEDGTDVGPGQCGEILYRSPSRFRGYLNDDEATRNAFAEGDWLKTGDVASMDEGGYLAFMDRKKEMIKSKGENVAAAEVERALNEHPDVAESAVIGVADPDGLWGERIAAYVVTRAGASIDATALQQWVGERLAEFKVPRSVHFIDQLPKTPLGKIQRGKLR